MAVQFPAHQNQLTDPDIDQTNLSTSARGCKHFCFTISLALILILHLCFDVLTSRPSIARFMSKKSDSLNSLDEGPCSCLSQNAKDFTNTYLSNRTRMREIVKDLWKDIAYVHSIDTIFSTMAKAGSSTTWHMVYLGLTGEPWKNNLCGNPQNKSSPCWRSYLSVVGHLSEDEQWHLLTNNKTLRVAVQREPFPRLISAFKNKLACDAATYNTTLSGERMHVLREQAMMPPGPNCMNVSEYAETLDRIRQNVGKPGFLKHMRQVDEHFRPRTFFADEIYYHLVLDASDLSNMTRISPFLDRLPYANLVRNANIHRLDSGSAPVMMDDKTARKLHDFAQLTTLAPCRYFD